MSEPSSAAEAVALAARPVDVDAIVDMVGDASFVLLGEASHGTADFYRIRADVTRRLIERAGFAGVVVEADWPDAHRVNCFVRGAGDDADAGAALGSFERFPAWMWRNTEVARFVDWLRSHNEAARDAARRVGFYGMDLYSLSRSVEAVIRYLEGVDPEAAARARERYACFDHFGDDSQAYGYAAAFGGGESCERDVVEQLTDLCRNAASYTTGDPATADDELFFAEQNARLVIDAERYYRAMFDRRVSTWNLRDRHMVGTIDALADHLGRRRGKRARLVVWAHNSHLGDARATEMGRGGELNVGQLMREGHPGDTFLLGFTTATGTVMAADDWDAPGHVKDVRTPLDGSYEHLFHELGRSEFLVPIRDDPDVAATLRVPRLERAIGVIYRPRTERFSHYFEATMAEQFDAVIHVDRTTALEPLPGAPGPR